MKEKKLTVTNLRCAAMVNPLGITLQHPVLSWIMESGQRGIMQTAYRVIVTEDSTQLSAEAPVAFYDSGRVESEDNQVKLPRLFTQSRVRYYWTVQIWDNKGNTACAGENTACAEAPAWFEIGLLYKKDWKAKWAEPVQMPVLFEYPVEINNGTPNDEALHLTALAQVNDESVLFPPHMLRKVFRLEKPVKKARIYATAHGVYELELNGSKVGDYELAPEVTPYQAYLQVQTYDVTGQLKAGDNCLGAIIGDGWWAGRIGNNGGSQQYGNTIALLAQLMVDFEDGTSCVIPMDQDVKASTGPLRYCDNYMGEKYDAHIRRDGWSTVEFKNTRMWQPCPVKNYGYDNLVGQNADHMKVVKTFEDVKVFRTPKGELVADVGQLIPGALTAHIKGVPHAAITFHYTQELDKDGNYWLEVMGTNSRHEDVYVLDETGEGNYDPLFSQTGFRYVWFEPSFGEIEVSNVKAKMICSPLETTLQFNTSNEKLNKLSENFRWTFLANAPSIPTDDCDRERAGFGGDGQMACETLMWHLDARAFYRRWYREMECEQYPDGMLGFIFPEWKDYKNMIKYWAKTTSAGWGDAGVLMPWRNYLRYGDKTLLEENYTMMKRYVAWISERAANHNPKDIGEITPERAARLQYIWNADFNFGDWLTPSACYDPKTDTYTYWSQTLTWLLGTYYYAYDTGIMAETAKILGYPEEERYYRTLNERIQAAAIKEFYDTGKIMESEYMGAQVMALHMGFCPPEEEQKVFDRLVAQIEEKGMDTGFISTMVVCDILAKYGRPDMAYNFILNEGFPSWLYMVDHDATTVWETMQAIQPDGTRQAVSFALTTFCSIGNWMVKGMTGIDAAEPGFKRIAIRPYLTDRLDYAGAAYESVYGAISSRWERKENGMAMEVTIPANTTGQILLPGAVAASSVTESGKALSEVDGIMSVAGTADGLLVEVGSGSYAFVW